MTDEDIVRELERLARKLGGSWKVEWQGRLSLNPGGRLPLVTLTIEEATRLVARLEGRPSPIERRYP